MANHNIFLKYENSNLMWSSTQDGTYQNVGPGNPLTPVGGTDTITFTAVSGIDKIQKITDGKNGSKKMIKSVKGEDSGTVVATIKDTTVKDEIDSYSIKFKPTTGSSLTVDPDLKGTAQP